MSATQAAEQFVLAFDTANESIAIGVGRLCVVTRTIHLVAEERAAAHRASNTQLLPRIDALLASAGIARDQIACVCVGTGPGSFTGVRIAIATAKGIASALEVALVGVSSLDAVAWGAWAAGVRGRLLVAGDAMRKEVYPAWYVLNAEGAERQSANRVVKADVFAEELAHENADFVAGDALGKYNLLPSKQLPEDVWTPTGSGILLALQHAWRAGECDPLDAARHAPGKLLPVYTRLSDAEEAERARLAKVDQKLAGNRGSKHVTMNDMALHTPGADAQGVAYKPLDRLHAADVAAMEAQVMGTDAWNEVLVADELGRADRVWWAAYAADPLMPLPADAPLVGYAGALVVDGDMQVLKVGVSPEHRRAGVARELLSRVAADARNLGATESSLEVRASNEGAKRFYKSLGYEEIGTRPKYYSDGEDAVIMRGSLPVGVFAPKSLVGAQQAAPAGAINCAPTPTSAINCVPTAADSTNCAHVNNMNRISVTRPLILAIESSCDETAAAMVDGEGDLLSDVVASQVDFHARFGGVVPEIASRKHTEAICGVCDQALEIRSFGPRHSERKAEGLESKNLAANPQQHCVKYNQLHYRDLDAVAATYAPGLVGALVVGVAFAKGVAWAADIPFIGVNHLEGHLYANKIGMPDFAPPAVVSLVSGGNTMLVYMRDWGEYEILGATIDDAVGEAFDKVAKALGLPYPGGPHISRLAAEGDPEAIAFPRAMMHSGDMRFSLSGLKTAVVMHINAEREAGRELNVPDICASFEAAVIDVQVKKAEMALDATGAPTFCLGGGVAANPELRQAYEEMCAHRGVKLVMPPISACGDNAAMIALVALDRYKAKKFFDLNADAQAHTDLSKPY